MKNPISSLRRRHMPLALIAAVTVAAVSVAQLAAAPAAVAVEPTSGLIAHYGFDQTSGAEVANLATGSDAVGDARVVNESATQWTGTSLVLTGGPKDSPSANYVRLPDAILAGKAAATVSVEAKIDQSMKSAFNFLWNVGNQDTSAYFFSSVRDNPRSAITTSSAPGEAVVAATSAVSADTWYNFTTVVDGSTIRYYIDGQLVDETPTTLTPASITDQSFNTIGRSPWPDANFRGEVSEFRVYDRALSEGEVSAVAEAAAEEHPVLEASATSCDVEADREGLQAVQQIDVPVNPNWAAQAPQYAVNNLSLLRAGFDRVGYCMELATPAGTTWAWAAMEAFSPRSDQIGIPTNSGDIRRLRVDDLTVASNTQQVTSGSQLSGYIEMWPNGYEPSNSHQVSGSSATAFDVEDVPSSQLYGSFQVSSVGAEKNASVPPSTVLAMNGFMTGGGLDIGIGNPVAGNSDYTFANNGAAYTARKLTVYARASSVRLTTSPSDRQLFPRDSEDGADVRVAGSVTDEQVDTVRLVVTNGSGTTVEEAEGDTFTFLARLEAGLDATDIRLETVSDGTVRTVSSWTQLVAGDVYVLQGQSNAQSAPWVNTGSTVYESEWIRSFGSITDNPLFSAADTSWNYGAGDLFFEQASVGQWALAMADTLVREEGVPIAIINGAHGGQPTGFFQRNDSKPGDISTNYGRLLNRLQGAEVVDALSGVFFYQGEAEVNDAATHAAGFHTLIEDWRTDFGGAREEDPKYYVFQTRTNGCGSVDNVAVREAQRRFATTEGVTVLSTTSIVGHDGCHFSWAGYEQLGVQAARTLQRDLFDGSAEGVAAPNPSSAAFRDQARDAVIVQLESTADPISVSGNPGVDFIVNGSSAAVTSVTALGGGRLQLQLSAPAPEATGLSYRGHLGDGPTVTTNSGVGLLAFDAMPIAAPVAPTITATSETRCVAGAVVLTVRVGNSSSDQLQVRAVSPFGSKIMTLAPAKSASIAFSARLKSVASGEVSVSVVSPQQGSSVVSQYIGRTC